MPDIFPADSNIRKPTVNTAASPPGETKYHLTIDKGYGVVSGDGAQVTQYIQTGSEPTIPLPPEPEHPPETTEFVGREVELADYADRLQQAHLAIIAGAPGVGKTWLAARLAHQSVTPDQLFWYAFHEGATGGEGVQALIWKLAAFLARQGRDDLWRMLQNARLTGSQPQPPEVLFDYLIQLLRGRGYLLCLDDFQHVDEDPLVNKLVQRLEAIVDAGEISLVLTSRRIPTFVRAFEPLAGLNPNDARLLLAGQGLVLPEDSIADLNICTGGNPQLLILASNALRGRADPAQLVAHLAEEADIARYLMAEVHNCLTTDEQSVMAAVAVLLGHRGTRHAIDAILAADAWATLAPLSDRCLLTVTQGAQGREYGQHAIIQAFYYEQLGRRQRREMHHRAGTYYETEERDVLKAGLHFQRAEEHERAAQLVVADVWALINEGRAGFLRGLLEQLKEGQIDSELLVRVNIARGQVYAFYRDIQAARQALDTAYALQARLPEATRSPVEQAIICRLMGELLKFEAPQEALGWLNEGLAAVSAALANPTGMRQSVLKSQAAALHIEAGSVYSKLGEFLNAIRELEQGLALLPDGNMAIRAAGLINLGIVYCRQGRATQGVACFQQSIEISQKLGDMLRVLSARHNLGIQMDVEGQWGAASQEHRWALDLAERLGSRKHQAQITLSLGILETKRGNYDSAGELLATSVAMARELGLQDHVVAAQSSLAQLRLRQGAAEAAGELLVAAEALAKELEARDQLPEIWRGQAEVALALGATDGALKLIERSIDLARELEMKPDLGMSQCMLGQILSARGEDARGAFEESLLLLRSQDPYEAARTEARWGLVLLGRGERDAARELLVGAGTAFQKLGAHRESAEVEAILGRTP